ncbi:hypothetical protein ACHAQA_008513 [Verticillium albo-atrum]
MKSVYAIAAFAAVVAAQSSGLPSCAIPCIREATESETDCTFGDYTCSCEPTNNAAIRAAATSCVIDACGVDVAVGEVIPATEALCANPPTTPAETTTAAEEEPTSAPEEPSASAPAPEPSAPAPEESAYPVPEVSSAPAASGSAYPVPEVSSTPVKPEEPTHAGNTTEPTPTHVEVDGAASVGFMGVAAMVGLAALAL